MAANMDDTNLSSARDSDFSHRHIRKVSRTSRRVSLGSIWYFLKQRVLYDFLLYPYARSVHRRVVQSAERSQAHTYTSFYRSPDQLDALVSQVIPRFAARAKAEKRPVSINVVACSTGAEAYTIASEIIDKCPGIDFRIQASDLHEHTVAQAQSARYSRAEVFHKDGIPAEFVLRTFDRDGDELVVKKSIRDKVSFKTANLLDPDLLRSFEPADIVFAQNVFFHLYPKDAEAAFTNVLGLLKERAALFIDGTELGMKERMTREADLVPLPYKLREIYSFARRHIPARWWHYYYGAEPYFSFRPGKFRRYSTIFFTRAAAQAMNSQT